VDNSGSGDGSSPIVDDEPEDNFSDNLASEPSGLDSYVDNFADDDDGATKASKPHATHSKAKAPSKKVKK
jgi:hypothetical protein